MKVLALLAVFLAAVASVSAFLTVPSHRCKCSVEHYWRVGVHAREHEENRDCLEMFFEPRKVIGGGRVCVGIGSDPCFL